MHADLAQLEKGDVVEALYESWALPGDTGNLTLDTPDLMPERTAVHEASIELHLPTGLKGALWSHPLLGAVHETNGAGGERVLHWAVHDRGARRIESGAPKMDGYVAVSFSTATWSDVGRGLSETLATFDERSPEVRRWTEQAISAAKSPDEKVRAIVEASGAAVKESSPGDLTDAGFGRPQGPQTLTARTALASRAGSRTWLIARALREAGVPAEVIVAESEPFSADPKYPVHFGRFTHPLVLAHVASDKSQAKDVWIDADVAGPPLPSGRISPALHGRVAMREDGTLLTVPPPPSGIERDEIDLRLVLDDHGTAKGTFTALLRGREAQEMAETFFRVVGSDRLRALRGVVLGWVPYATVEDVALSSSEGSWQVAVRAALTVSGFAQAEVARAARASRVPSRETNASAKEVTDGPPGASAGKETTYWIAGVDPLHVVFPEPFSSTFGATFVRQGARESALAINDAYHYHVHRRIELPKGMQVTRTPGPFEASASGMHASRTLTVGRAGEAQAFVEDEFLLDLPTGTVPAAEYDAFTRAAHRTDEAFLGAVRLAPQAAAKPTATGQAPAKPTATGQAPAKPTATGQAAAKPASAPTP
jgi:hypothetical protein